MNHGYRQSQEFFEARYQASADPWKFSSSAYERDRYRATLAALSGNCYRRAYEPGCSVGVLTSALATRCKQVVACDISKSAVQQARARCLPCGNVTVERRDAADGAPVGTFDLIVFSELGYYFSAARLSMLAKDLATRLDSGGEFIAVHWLGHSADHVLHGDVVHDVLAASLGCEPIAGSRHDGFRIDSWRRVP